MNACPYLMFFFSKLENTSEMKELAIYIIENAALSHSDELTSNDVLIPSDVPGDGIKRDPNMH